MSPRPPDILRKSHRHDEGNERANAKAELERELVAVIAETTARRAFAGRCRCGAIGYTYYTEIPPAEWAVRACQCSFCREHDAASTSDPAGTFQLTVNDPAAVELRRFGLKTADFVICRRCGAYVAAVIETASGRRATFNVHLLLDAPPDLPHAEPADYDGETAEERIRRREMRWTPLTPDSADLAERSE
jgi:hypothetical protein